MGWRKDRSDALIAGSGQSSKGSRWRRVVSSVALGYKDFARISNIAYALEDTYAATVRIMLKDALPRIEKQVFGEVQDPVEALKQLLARKKAHRLAKARKGEIGQNKRSENSYEAAKFPRPTELDEDENDN